MKENRKKDKRTSLKQKEKEEGIHNQERLGEQKIKGKIDTIQTTILIRSARILSKVLET